MVKTTLATLLMIAVGIAPQAPGSIEGVVVTSGTNQPLGEALVTLSRVTSLAANTPGLVVSGNTGGIPGDATVIASSGSSARVVNSVTTDADGRFSFQVEAGLYSLQVLRDGYSRNSYGQRVVGGPVSAIRLGAGQSVKIAMTLVPAGNLSGVIRGVGGRPQTGVPIQLLRAKYNANGQFAFEVEGTGKTNDRGEYRLYWITPGRYYISGGTPAGPNGIHTKQAEASPNEIPNRTFAFTYYPGVMNPAGAALIDVNPGAELNGVDFVVADQQLHSVRGRILDGTTGQPPRAVGLSLAYRTLGGDSGAFSKGEKYDPGSGEFELRNVPPGQYVLQAVAVDEPEAPENETLLKITPLAIRPNARVPIEILSSDLDGLQLTLTTGITLAGRITVEGMPLSSLNGWSQIRVPLKPTLNGTFGPYTQPAIPVPQAPTADGSFQIIGVSPGEFTVGPLAGLPTGFYVREARFNGADVLSRPLRFTGTIGTPLEIVISPRTGQVQGAAVDGRSATASGARIVLVPDRERSRTDLYRATFSDTAGRFQFRNVPPGDYRVFGWEALESYAYFDQELLRRSEPQSVPIHVAESATDVITLRIVPAAQ